MDVSKNIYNMSYMRYRTLPVLTVNGLVDCRMQLIFLSRVKLLQMTIAPGAGWNVPPGFSEASELFASSLSVPEHTTSS